MKVLKSILLITVSFCFCMHVSAHHSSSAFDTRTEIELTGVVTDVRWRNPHVFIKINIKQADGSSVEREIEAGSSSVLIPLGVTKDSITVGEQVTVKVNPPRRNPETGMVLGKELIKSDGTYVPLFISGRSLRAKTDTSAQSIEGTWFSPMSEFVQFLGATRSWPMTEKGVAAASKGNATDTVQANCIPIGAPALMVYPVTQSIIVDDEHVILKVDWMSTERVVHLNGEHSKNITDTLHGHSIGHWEGDTLVVDTVNFAPHDAGLSTSLPSSSKKHLIERFKISDDGKRLIYSGTMEDSEFLASPVEFSAQLDYSPDLKHSGEECDLDIARRFLNQDQE